MPTDRRPTSCSDEMRSRLDAIFEDMPDGEKGRLDDLRESVRRFLDDGGGLDDLREVGDSTSTDLHTRLMDAKEQAIAFVLLEAGAGLEVLSPRKRTALHEAAGENRVDVVKLLVRAGADTEARDDEGLTPLCLALERRKWAAANALVEAGANPNAADDDGTTPLCKAARTQCMEDGSESRARLHLTKALLAAGANPSARDKEGQSPLDHAVASESLDVLRILAGRRDCKEQLSGALLHALRGGKPAALEALLDMGASPALACDGDGATATHLAARWWHLPDMKRLLEAGALVDPKAKDGRTPLMEALSCNKKTVARLLLSRGADPSAADSQGITPAMIAAEKTPELLKLVLKANCEKNARDRDGRTALMHAVLAPRLECVRLLLDAGADACLKDASGHTALDMARANPRLSSIIQQAFDRHSPDGRNPELSTIADMLGGTSDFADSLPVQPRNEAAACPPTLESDGSPGHASATDGSAPSSPSRKANSIEAFLGCPSTPPAPSGEGAEEAHADVAPGASASGAALDASDWQRKSASRWASLLLSTAKKGLEELLKK